MGLISRVSFYAQPKAFGILHPIGKPGAHWVPSQSSALWKLKRSSKTYQKIPALQLGI